VKGAKKMVITKNYNPNLPLVLYGAGITAHGIYKMFEKEGVKAVCFADKDKNKHNKQIFPDIPIFTYSIEEVLRKFPDCQIFVTVFSVVRYDIFHELTEMLHLSKERIINFEEYEKRLTCKNLEGLGRFANDIRWCCYKANVAYTPYVKIEDNLGNAFQRFSDLKISTIKALASGQPVEYCNNCGYLENMYCGKKMTITNLSFGTAGHNYSLCNFKCSYCVEENHKWNYNPNPESDPVKVLKMLESKELISPYYTRVGFANGEITILPYCDEFLDSAKRYILQIYTNASVYNKKLADMLRNEMTRINVSVDAGTRETFARIKRVDCFEKVSNNLIRYGETKGDIILKYIFLPNINDDEANVEGFMKLCQKVGNKIVSLSYDFEYTVAIDNVILEKLINFGRYFNDNGFIINYFRDGAFPKHIFDRLKAV
jgi:pyruvate-formate lyase-activating enzyme